MCNNMYTYMHIYANGALVLQSRYNGALMVLIMVLEWRYNGAVTVLHLWSNVGVIMLHVQWCYNCGILVGCSLVI